MAKLSSVSPILQLSLESSVNTVPYSNHMEFNAGIMSCLHDFGPTTSLVVFEPFQVIFLSEPNVVFSVMKGAIKMDQIYLAKLTPSHPLVGVSHF